MHDFAEVQDSSFKLIVCFSAQVYKWRETKRCSAGLANLVAKRKTGQMLDDDAISRVRVSINAIFTSAVKENQPFIQLHFGELLPETTEWIIRAHLPVRIYPRGSPVLLLSALDIRQIDRSKQSNSFTRILCDGDSSKMLMGFSMKTEEEIQLFRYILRFNSTKVQPNS